MRRIARQVRTQHIWRTVGYERHSVAGFQARPGSISELKNLFGEILPDTCSYEGCERLEVKPDLDDGDDSLILERWESRQLYEKDFA